MVYSQPGVIEAQAATKNNITAVGIKALPKNNTIELGEYFNFDPVILNTEKGKGKETTGVVYFEVNGKTNTAGVQSARWGNIYPVFAGQFDVRAVAFANSSDMRAWLAARKANGYVEDAKAGARYVTAYSDWQTIKVTSSEEGLAVARWQKQLDLALKNKNVSNVLFTTDAEKEFTLKKGNYRYKAITIDAPNADIVNEGRFKEITVEQIKSSTFYEKAIGNKFIVTAPNASFHVEKDATVNQFIYRPAASSSTTTVTPKLNIFGNGGSIDKVSIESKGEVNIDGKTENTVPVVVEETAAGTVLNTNIQLDLNVNASITLDVGAAATNTVVNLLKAVEAILSGAAETLNVNVSKEAEGAVVKSETSVTIKADANVKVELGEGAEGSEITTGENVNVEVKNDTTEDVTVKDNDGNSTTVEKGEEVAPTVTPTPVPTSTPNPPVTTTPVPTATPIPTAAPTTTPELTIEFAADNAKEVEVGSDITLKVNVTPDGKEVEWSINSDNATITQEGVLEGVKAGEVIVTATIKGTDANATWTVEVKAASGGDDTKNNDATLKTLNYQIEGATSVVLDPTNSDTFIVKLNATGKATLGYETTDTKATVEKPESVDITGLVTKATITVTAEDGTTKKDYTIYFFVNPITQDGIKVTTGNSVTGATSTAVVMDNGVVEVEVAANDEVTLTVTEISGSSEQNVTVSYQWYKADAKNVNGTAIQNETSKTLKLTSQKKKYYYVEVTITLKIGEKTDYFTGSSKKSE